MGMSNAYGGPEGNTPLVPSWLEPTPGATVAPATPASIGPRPDSAPPIPSPPARPPLPAAADAARFSSARNSFSRFARSAGSDRAGLGRAVSTYVSTTCGGPRHAARRMGSSCGSAGRLVGFLADAATRGPREALRTLNLEVLAGRPVEEVFLGLVDYICPDGGTIDEGIARDAFIETIADLAGSGIASLDTLSADQIHTVFELYAAHAIEARLCNDVGTRVIILPSDARAAERVQMQVFDFIRRGVSDALAEARASMDVLTPDRVLIFVNGVYERAFEILQGLGQAEEEAA